MIFSSGRHLKLFIILSVAAAALIAISSRIMLVRVEQESMLPTLRSRQLLLVIRNKELIQPGDIAVFRSPVDGLLTVKRCILEGGMIPEVNHGMLETPWGRWYVSESQWEKLDTTAPLPDNVFFMVGDNQFQSLDSRSYGPVPAKNMVGRVWRPSYRKSHG